MRKYLAVFTLLSAVACTRGSDDKVTCQEMGQAASKINGMQIDSSVSKNDFLAACSAVAAKYSDKACVNNQAVYRMQVDCPAAADAKALNEKSYSYDWQAKGAVTLVGSNNSVFTPRDSIDDSTPSASSAKGWSSPSPAARTHYDDYYGSTPDAAAAPPAPAADYPAAPPQAPPSAPPAAPPAPQAAVPEVVPAPPKPTFSEDMDLDKITDSYRVVVDLLDESALASLNRTTKSDRYMGSDQKIHIHFSESQAVESPVCRANFPKTYSSPFRPSVSRRTRAYNDAIIGSQISSASLDEISLSTWDDKGIQCFVAHDQVLSVNKLNEIYSGILKFSLEAN